MYRIIRTQKVLKNTLNLCPAAGYKTKSLPDLTQNRYKVQRLNYAKPTDKDISFFESILQAPNVLTDSSETQGYNVDFLGSVRGQSNIVLKPKTTQEVSKILKYCNDNNIAVCPQGGNTGLVGGSVPVFDEVILSSARMNEIEAIDEYSNIVTCQSGCILENLDAKAGEHGMTFPLDMGSKGSCNIGGNASTNAGGLRVIRYGMLHGSVLGLEVVLADGTVLDLMSNFKKDNTGYHLKHLFIGSEGTLGFITKLSILCPQKSKSVNVAFFGVKTFEDVLNNFVSAKKNLGEILSACELIDYESLTSCTQTYNLQCPIDNNFPFYMLIETSGSNEKHDEEKLNDFLDKQMSSNKILDGVVVNEPSKINSMWQLREKVPSSLVEGTYCHKYDISLPLKNFYQIVEVMRERIGNHLKCRRVTGYGHIGDSNLHLNIQCEEYDKDLHKIVEPFVYEYTSKLGGSISAEHGIGFLKTQYLQYSKKREAVELMKTLKGLFDPKNILNPYKVLPEVVKDL